MVDVTCCFSLRRQQSRGLDCKRPARRRSSHVSLITQIVFLYEKDATEMINSFDPEARPVTGACRSKHSWLACSRREICSRHNRLPAAQELPVAVGGKKILVPIAEATAMHKAAPVVKAALPNSHQTNGGFVSENGTMRFAHD